MIDRQTAEHYTWGSKCDGWHLVQNSALSVIEERMPPGTCEVRHFHQRAAQFFYVLRGVLSVGIEGNEADLHGGQGIEIAAGQTHEVRNKSAADVEFLVISCPPSRGDRVECDGAQ
jgi:mannose-6-phosphate isomerase-like protein (cupin superfamily)